MWPCHTMEVFNLQFCFMLYRLFWCWEPGAEKGLLGVPFVNLLKVTLLSSQHPVIYMHVTTFSRNICSVAQSYIRTTWIYTSYQLGHPNLVVETLAPPRTIKYTYNNLYQLFKLPKYVLVSLYYDLLSFLTTCHLTYSRHCCHMNNARMSNEEWIFAIKYHFLAVVQLK